MMTTTGCSEISWGRDNHVKVKYKRDCCEQQMPKSHFIIFCAEGHVVARWAGGWGATPNGGPSSGAVLMVQRICTPNPAAKATATVLRRCSSSVTSPRRSTASHLKAVIADAPARPKLPDVVI